MLRVAAYTAGKRVASARFRVRQYVPALSRLGVELREYPAGFGSYPPASKLLRPLWGAASVSERILRAQTSFLCEVTLLQREMVSTFLTAEPLTRAPRVLDVDDAILMHGKGWAARRLARFCQMVICGNDFLAENFGQWNPNVRVLPTAVDTERFHPCAPASPTSPLKRIGWSGQSSNFAYFDVMLSALRAVLERWKDVVFRVVADRRPRLEGIAEDRIEFIRWSPEIEVRAIQDMSIGVMPLADVPWARESVGSSC